MFIQSVCIDYIPVETIITSIFGDSPHAKRQAWLANAALGVIASASIIVERVGMGLARAQWLFGKDAVRQVDRLLGNKNLSVWDSFAYTVPYAIGDRKEIVVAMDWTDFDADKQAMLQISLIPRHGRVTPLLWKTVSKTDLKDQRNAYEEELLLRFKQVLPTDVKVTVLADRGYGDIKPYDYLRKGLGFDIVIRFRGKVKVTDDKGETRIAPEWVGENGHARKLKKAKVAGQVNEVPVVVCMKAKGMKQAWCIAASNPELSTSQLVSWYTTRWGCEPQSKVTKDLHLEMGLEEISIKDCQRRDRLLLIYELAMMILTVLGAAGEKLGMDRDLKANTVKHRTLSLLRQGCHYYRWLSAPKRDQLKALIECFTELMDGQQALTELLGVM